MGENTKIMSYVEALRETTRQEMRRDRAVYLIGEDVGRWGNYLVAAIFFQVGLHLLDVIPMPWSGPGQVGMKRKGLLAALLLGLVFGIAIGPCTFAYMAPMLGVTFRVASTRLLYGISLLLAYGLGHCAVIIAAGTSTGLVQRYLNWNERSKGAIILKKICGILQIQQNFTRICLTKKPDQTLKQTQVQTV